MRIRTVLTTCLMLVAVFALPARADAGRFTNVSPEGASISSLLVDPMHPSTVYAATRGGIYRSDDGGDSWSLSFDPSSTTDGSPLVDRWMSAIAIDPAHTATLYAGMSNGEVVKSIDGGATWSLLDGLASNRAFASSCWTSPEPRSSL